MGILERARKYISGSAHLMGSTAAFSSACSIWMSSVVGIFFIIFSRWSSVKLTMDVRFLIMIGMSGSARFRRMPTALDVLPLSAVLFLGFLDFFDEPSLPEPPDLP